MVSMNMHALHTRTCHTAPMQDLRHVPVLLRETINLLAPQPGETACDVTLGLGGHASALLEAIGSTGTLIGVDADEKNLAIARENLQPWQSQTQLVHANFRTLEDLKLPPLDMLLADMGLSSLHVDDATRGFTFREDHPLDLRFDRSTGIPAAEWLRFIDARELIDLFRDNGIERSRSLVERIITAPPTTTGELRQCVEDIFTWRAKRVLPQVFQAIRIGVNDELGSLKELLRVGPTLLAPGGRFAVISYHSLEDRLVKHTFRMLTAGEKREDTGAIDVPAPFRLLTRHAVVPSEAELAENPRSRSGKLRAIQNTL